MKTTFDTDLILFQVLKGANIGNNGGIYKHGERPAGSCKEDIVVNTIELTQEYVPQIGTSNVNIHVTDRDVLIDGRNQKQSDSPRLKVLTDEVLAALRSAKISGLKFVTEGQTVIKDQDVAGQHYCNIRIAWYIHE